MPNSPTGQETDPILLKLIKNTAQHRFSGPGLDLGQTGLVFGGFQKPPDWVPVLVWGAKLPFPFLLASQNKRELQSDCFAAWRREEKGWVAFGLR